MTDRLSIVKLDDVCLIKDKWVSIQTLNSDEGLPDLITDAVELAKSRNLDRIEMDVLTQDVTYINMLQKSYGFVPGLVLMVKTAGQVIREDGNLKVQWNKIDAVNIRHLLTQQADIHYEVEPRYYRSSQDIRWDVYLNEIDEARQDPSLIHGTVMANNNPIAFVYGEIKNHHADLWDLIVDETYRGKGVGSMLMNEVERYAANKGVRKIKLETWHTMNAYAWYLNLGFKPVSQSLLKFI